MSDFIQWHKFFYTQEEAEAFGRQLGGENGVFQVRRIPGTPIEDVGPMGTRRWIPVAEYAVFIPSSR